MIARIRFLKAVYLCGLLENNISDAALLGECEKKLLAPRLWTTCYGLLHNETVLKHHHLDKHIIS